MHIEPGLVEPAKLAVGYMTAAGVLGVAVLSALGEIGRGNVMRLGAGALVTLLVTLMSFEILPHPTVGVSEVHLILGATLYLLFGFAPVAAGMAGALLIQGLLFDPSDIAQYGMNVTTLLASLSLTAFVANRVIAPNYKYVDVPYTKLVQLALLFQGSVVAWVAFWVSLGQGLSTTALQNIASFATAYSIVVVFEVVVSLALLSVLRANELGRMRRVLNPRLFCQSPA